MSHVYVYVPLQGGGSVHMLQGVAPVRVSAHPHKEVCTLVMADGETIKPAVGWETLQRKLQLEALTIDATGACAVAAPASSLATGQVPPSLVSNVREEVMKELAAQRHSQLTEFREIEAKLAAQAAQVGHRESQLAETDRALTFREQQLSTHERSLSERESVLALEQQKLAARLEQLRVEQDNLVNERAVLREVSAELSSRESAVQAREAALAGADAEHVRASRSAQPEPTPALPADGESSR